MTATTDMKTPEATMAANVELADLGNVAMLLGTLYLQSPKEEAVATTINGLCTFDLENEWPFGEAQELKAISALLNEAQNTDLAALDRVYHHLFVGPNTLVAPPWGSVYQDAEAVVFGDSCVNLTRWMRAHGIGLHEETSREPADHIGRMLVLLAWLCKHDPTLVDEYLSRHLLPWTPRYLVALTQAAQAEKSPFYEGLARLTNISLQEVAQQRNIA